MFVPNRKMNIATLSMRFSDGGAQPSAEPTPAPAPAPAPAPEPAPAPVLDEPSSEPAPDVSELQRQLDAAKKAKDAAERALNLEKSAHSKLKREHMTEAELLAEQKQAMEEKARMYDRQMNAITAEKILVGAGLKGDDYESLLNLIISEDAEKTEATAQAIVDMLSFVKMQTAKSEREKILKETPLPPAGDTAGAVDPFLEGFKNG